MLERSSVLFFCFFVLFLLSFPSSREWKNPWEISRVTFLRKRSPVTRLRERYSLGYWKTDRADWKQCKGRAARSENREIYFSVCCIHRAASASEEVLTRRDGVVTSVNWIDQHSRRSVEPALHSIEYSRRTRKCRTVSCVLVEFPRRVETVSLDANSPISNSWFRTCLFPCLDRHTVLAASRQNACAASSCFGESFLSIERGTTRAYMVNRFLAFRFSFSLPRDCKIDATFFFYFIARKSWSHWGIIGNHPRRNKRECFLRS